MSITVDINVLIGAVNKADPHQPACSSLIERLAGGPGPWHLFWPTLSGFIRIATHASITPRPLSVETATGVVEMLLESPAVRVHGELDGFESFFAQAQSEARGGNDVPDAHLVALMRQHGVDTIYTRDRGFRRFDGIRVRDPAAG